MSSGLVPRKTSRASRSRHGLDGDAIKRFLVDAFPDLLPLANGAFGEPSKFYPASRILGSANHELTTGRLGIFADSLLFVPWPAQPATRPEQFKSRLIRSVGGFIKRNRPEHYLSPAPDRVSERETVPLRFPLCYIKEYGVTGTVFSLSCGRHFETGPTVVNFISDHAMQLFEAIQQNFQNMSNERRLKEQAAIATASTCLRSSSSSATFHHRSDSLDLNVPALRRRLKKGGSGTPQAVLRSLRGVANRYTRRRYSLQTQAQQQQSTTTSSDCHKCPRRRFVTFRKPHYPNNDYDDNNNNFCNNKSSHPSSNSGGSNSSAGSSYEYHRLVTGIPESSFRALSLSRNDCGSGGRRDGPNDIFAEIKLPDLNNTPASSVPLSGSVRISDKVVHLFKPRLPTPPVARRASDDTDIRNCYQNTSNMLSNDLDALKISPFPISSLDQSKPKPIFGLATMVGCRTGICFPADSDNSIYQYLPKRVEVSDYQPASDADDIYVDQTLDYTTVQVIGNHNNPQDVQNNKDKVEEEVKLEVATAPLAPPAALPEIRSSDHFDKPQRPPIRKLSLGRIILATNAISKFLARKTLKTPTADKPVWPTADVPVSSSTPPPLKSNNANSTNGALNYVTIDMAKMRAFEILESENF